MRHFDVSQISGRILRVFITVYDEMSVSRAAEVLDSSQSTVSHTIEKLRGLLGDPLFVQSGRGIVPTPRAEALAPRIRQLLAGMEALADTGGYTPELDPEPLAIVSNGASMAAELGLIQQRIWQQLPEKHVIFRELATRENLEAFLGSGGADIALSSRRGAYPAALMHQPLFTETPRIYFDASQRAPVGTLEDYCQAPHALLEFSSGPVKSGLGLALEARGLTRETAITVPNVWLLAQALKGSRLIATLPPRVARPACDGLASCALPLDLAPVQFDLVWHRRHSESAKLGWLRSQILAALT
ncbi:LysR family transcriptional regulator [Roseobacteraceae bacterium NS-SX3]